MSCDCTNTYNLNLGCCVPVVANADNYYTKDEVDEKLEEVVISGGGVTYNEMESYVSGYTYDKNTIQQMVASGGSFDPSSYYTTTETDALLNKKLDASAYTPTDLSNYDTKSEVNNKISSATSLVNSALTAHTANTNVHVTAQDKTNWNNKSNFSGSYNDLTDKPTIPTVPTDVSAFNNDAGYLTQHQSLSGYATEQYVQNYTYDKATIDEKVAGGGTFDPTQYYTTANTYNKTEVDNLIPTIPTSNTAFTNDAGYITSDAISGKADTSAVTESINAAVSGKVDASTYNAYTAATATEITNKLSTSAFNSYSGAVDTSLNSKASQSDLSGLTDVVSAHTANTNIHVTVQDKTNWDAKADSSALNNYMLKTQIWCGDETAWSQISGSTQNDVIYLVY